MMRISERTARLGWGYYAFELLVLPGILLGLAGRFGAGEAEVNFVYYLLNFVCVCAIFRDALRASLERAGRGALALALAGTAVCWAVNAGLGMLMTRLAPGFSNANDGAVIAMAARHPILMGVGTVLLVPVAEECLFRGLVFSRLRPVNRGAAYSLSVLSFCAIHVVGFVGTCSPAVLALCFVQYVPAGLILAWSCDRSGTIIAPILIHSAINAIAFLQVA